jgi:hypothetical protein
MRMRAIGRAAAVHRALVIEGTISLQRGLHPRLVATQLSRTALSWPSKEPARWTVPLQAESKVSL